MNRCLVIRDGFVDFLGFRKKYFEAKIGLLGAARGRENVMYVREKGDGMS